MTTDPEATHEEGKGKSKNQQKTSERRRTQTEFLGFRLPAEELKALELAAEAAGESVSEYVRTAILMRREGHLFVDHSASISIGTPSMQVDHKSSWPQTVSPPIPLTPPSSDS